MATDVRDEVEIEIQMESWAEAESGDEADD